MEITMVFVMGITALCVVFSATVVELIRNQREERGELMDRIMAKSLEEFRQKEGGGPKRVKSPYDRAIENWKKPPDEAGE